MRSGWILLVVGCATGALAQQQPPPNLATLTTLYRFTLGGPEGYSPLGGLARGPDGNFYGATIAGGSTTCRCGSVFRITPGGEYTRIYEFKSTDGMAPRAQMVFDRDGNLWGTSWGPGIGAGRIFRLTLNGEYTLFPTPLPGYAPHGLILASDGNFYGTTARGGAGDGTFFRVSTTGQVTLLHSFVLRTDTIMIPSQIIEGRDGNFYGTTANSVFRLTPTGTLSIVTGGASGIAGLAGAVAGVTQSASGDFYGPAVNGIFKVTAAGAVSAVIRYADVGLTFDEGNPNNDGRSRLTLGSDGSLYGVNRSQTRTAAYRITPGDQFQILYRFPYFTPPITFTNPEGNDPSRLVEGTDGWYGVAAVGGPVPLAGGTVFKLKVDGGGGGGNPPPVVSNNVLGPIEFLDPNSSGDWNSEYTLRTLLLGESTWNDNSYPAFALAPASAEAVAADGATPLVIRVEVPAVDAQNGASVVFRLSESNGDETTTASSGTLGCIRDKACALSGGVLMTGDLQKIPDGRYVAFARLTSPVDFVRPNRSDEGLKDRPITIEAKLLRPGYVDRPRLGSIALVRPPVVLLHGLWSNERTWRWTDEASADRPAGLQKDPRFLVRTLDYENSHAQPFAENLGLLPGPGSNVPQAAIAKALKAFRDARMAATRVDFVGHSMGGLLARYYAGEYEPSNGAAKMLYYRADNLYAGDIHKLITLDTPHRGSDIANAMVDASGTNETTWGSLFNRLGCMTCGAVADLRVGSEMLQSLPSPDLPSHAIVGIGAIETFRNVGETTAKLEQLSVITPPQATALIALVNASIDGVSFLEQYFLGGAQHDVIVSAASQTGGIDASAVTFFNAENPVANPLWAALHFTVTHDSRISKRVIDLLHAPVSSPLFARFPKNN